MMANLKRWISGNQKSQTRKAATLLPEAISGDFSQKSAGVQVAAKLLPNCYPKQSGLLPEKQAATGTGPENCEKPAQVAGSRVAGSENEKRDSTTFADSGDGHSESGAETQDNNPNGARLVLLPPRNPFTKPELDSWTDRLAEVPESWREGLGNVLWKEPPANTPLRCWRAIAEKALSFAVSFDVSWSLWDDLELFGADARKPYERLDHLGLALSCGGDVKEITDRYAITEKSGLRILRAPKLSIGPPERALLWDL